MERFSCVNIHWNPSPLISLAATVEKKHFIRNIAVSAAALAAYGYSHGADLLKARGIVPKEFEGRGGGT